MIMKELGAWIFVDILGLSQTEFLLDFIGIFLLVVLF